MKLRVLGFALVLACAGLAPLTARDGQAIPIFPPATYTVDTKSDAMLSTCDPNAGGDCSLRGAITRANGHFANGRDTIAFDIGLGGVATINVNSTGLGALPPVTDAVMIDGTTQPPGGFPKGTPCGVAPCIRINGSEAGNAASGLTISANGATVKGLSVYGFSDYGIRTTGDNDTFVFNYLGTPDGLTAAANDTGIWIEGAASGAVIGGTSSADRNVISSNVYGIVISGSGATVAGNYVGVNRAGTGALSNDEGNIDVEGADAIIGGTAAGARNVISGSQLEYGIFLRGVDAAVQGNLIGANAAGTSAIPNIWGIRVAGSGNTVGGSSPSARNVISGSVYGVSLESGPNMIEGNYIGTDISGTAPIPNETGVELTTDNNIIGGESSGARNVISGNGTGISIYFGSSN